jgi:CDP-diacylglycerol--glycerol-3-phosphate 3-phosphatidyltransferase
MALSADESIAAWSRRHGDYDAARSALARAWLRLMWQLSGPIARIPPDVASAAGVLCAASGAARPRNRTTAAGLVVATAMFDGLDGAVAHRRSGPSRHGAVVDTTADRVTDALFLLALRRAGARRHLVAAAALGTAALETQRAIARRHGEPVTVVTPGERPMRVGYVVLGLVSSPSAGAMVVAGTTAAGALGLYRGRGRTR